MTTTDEARERAHEVLGWSAPGSPYHSAGAGEYAGVKFGPKTDLHYDYPSRDQCDRLTALILSHASDLAAVQADAQRLKDAAKVAHKALGAAQASTYRAEADLAAVRLENERQAEEVRRLALLNIDVNRECAGLQRDLAALRAELADLTAHVQQATDEHAMVIGKLARAEGMLGHWMHWASGVAFKSPLGEECVTDTDALLASSESAPDATVAALRAEVELLKERIDLCPECAGGGIDDAGRPCDCKATGDVLMLVANLRTERDAAREALAASTARAERTEAELARVRGRGEAT